MSALLAVAKLASDIVVSTGVGAVVGNTVKLSTPSNVGLVKKITIAVGGLVLSNLVADKASKYASEQIDLGVEQIRNLKGLKQFISKK